MRKEKNKAQPLCTTRRQGKGTPCQGVQVAGRCPGPDRFTDGTPETGVGNRENCCSCRGDPPNGCQQLWEGMAGVSVPLH